jgi:hypothetical protein
LNFREANIRGGGKTLYVVFNDLYKLLSKGVGAGGVTHSIPYHQPYISDDLWNFFLKTT